MKPGDAQPELPAGAGEATVARLDKLRLSDGPHSTFAIRRNMQRTMQVRGRTQGMGSAQTGYYAQCMPQTVSVLCWVVCVGLLIKASYEGITARVTMLYNAMGVIVPDVLVPALLNLYARRPATHG